MSTSTLHLGIFYMLQICDMGPTALLPLWRKACWEFFRPAKSWWLQPGLNPRTWVLKGSTLPRPLKPLRKTPTQNMFWEWHNTEWPSTKTPFPDDTQNSNLFMSHDLCIILIYTVIAPTNFNTLLIYLSALVFTNTEYIRIIHRSWVI